jgi:P-type E1-E2 ATPase
LPVHGLVSLPGPETGLECLVAIDDRVAALLRFRDTPRFESQAFVRHLAPRHGIDRMLLVSGDRAPEVEYVAAVVGLTEVYAGQSPEQKLAITRAETARQPTLFVGDGLNDAPAMRAATVSVAIGHGQEVVADAADVVILEGALSRVDELLHIARRTRRIALQSAVGGIVLSLIGMGVAAGGWLPALAGAIAQEVIDAAAIINALRTAGRSGTLTDY